MASHKNITKKIKIEKDTVVAAIVEAEANPAPENPGQESPNPNNPQPNPNPNPQPQPNPNPTPSTKYKVTITQPENGKIEVTPALPTDGTVDKGSELTFTLSANTGFKVKTLIIGGTAYSDITDKRITQKVKIEKNTEVSGVAEAETNPTQPNSDYENKNNGSSVKIVKQNNGQGAALTGNIYIDDLISNDFKEKLKDITGNIETSNLKINCFKPKTISGQSIQIKSITDNFEAKEITPKILEDVLQLKKERKFSILTLNNETPNGPIDILFTTKDTEGNKYFDINNLAKFRFSDTFKLDNSSNILLGGEKKDVVNEYGQTVSHYPKISELLKLIKNEKLNNIKVGSVELSGNVGEILQKLVNKEIPEQETGKSIRFIYDQNLCDTDFYTGYFGTKSNPNLSAEQIQEYYNRSDIMQLDDVTITGLNSENYKGSFIRNMLTNVNFINCDLSKISFHKSQTGGGYLKFENTTLPENMEGAAIDHLILKNSKLPQNLIALPSFTSATNTSLRIYNRDKDFFSLLKSEIDEIEVGHPPIRYIGPKDIWKDIEYEEGKIRKGLKNGYPKLKNNEEPIKFHFTEDDKTDTDLEALEYTIENTTGSLNKSLTQLLALIQNQGRASG